MAQVLLKQVSHSSPHSDASSVLYHYWQHAQNNLSMQSTMQAYFKNRSYHYRNYSALLETKVLYQNYLKLAFIHEQMLRRAGNAELFFPAQPVRALLAPPSRLSYFQLIQSLRPRAPRSPIAELRRVLHMCNVGLKSRPLAFGSMIACAKSGLADYFAQRVMEGRSSDDINWRRTWLFTGFGYLYGGVAMFFIYSRLYPWLFRGVNQWKNRYSAAAFQACFDLFVHSSLVYYPTFYVVKSACYDGVSLHNALSALRLYFGENMREDVAACCKIWIPANMITFMLIPNHLRVPWLAAVSFVWTVVLSLLRGEEGQETHA